MAKSGGKKGPVARLEDIGGARPKPSVAAAALATDRDVTDVDPGDLGRFIKQTVLNGFTCVEYLAGTRIMLSVHP